MPFMFLRSRCNVVYGTPTMFTDMVSQDLHKFDLSSVEAGKRFKNLIIEFGVMFRKHLKHPRLCAAVF